MLSQSVLLFNHKNHDDTIVSVCVAHVAEKQGVHFLSVGSLWVVVHDFILELYLVYGVSLITIIEHMGWHYPVVLVYVCVCVI